MKYKRRKWHIVVTVVLLAYCTITLALVANVLMSSSKSLGEIMAQPWGLPRQWTTANYRELFVTENFTTYFANSLLVTVVSLACVIYISALTAYGIRIMRGRIKRLVFGFFMIGLMFPIQLSLVPLFSLMRDLGLLGHIGSVICFNIANLSLPLFLVYNYLSSIPFSLIEAACVDGAKPLRLFNAIVLPLLKPVFASLIPLLAVGYWNDFFLPMLFLSRDSMKTVPLGLMKFYVGQYFNMQKLHLVYTAAAVSIIPMIMVYLAASNKIVSGITSGAVKA